MSGISTNALSELCSSSDERAIHLSHVLKFSVLRKDRELLAIGGSWNPALDGGDPLVSDYGLIKAAIRS
jgi:DBC1